MRGEWMQSSRDNITGILRDAIFPLPLLQRGGILNIAHVNYAPTYNRVLYPPWIESRGRNSQHLRERKTLGFRLGEI